MFRKTVMPIMEEITDRSGQKATMVVGTQIEYRLFGLPLYRKTLHTPLKYGMTEGGYEWYYRI